MYASMKVKELKDLMNQRGIPIYKHYKKKDLVVAIKMRDVLEKQEIKQFSKTLNEKSIRIPELRVSKTMIDLNDFTSPLFEIQTDVNEYLYPILTEPEANPGDFPNNITEVYWGYADDDDSGYEGGIWKLFCKLDNGNYAYLDATACSCGFGMWPDQLKLYVTKSYEDIITYAMSQSDYESYIEDTEPIEKKISEESSCGCMKMEETIIMFA
jgi:hypothetical protein